MASGAIAHTNFPSRGTYATANKLPDRAALNNPPPPPFGQLSTSRRQEQHQHQSQLPPSIGQGGRQGLDKGSSALSELSEEQREEINEAVRCTFQSAKQLLIAI